MKKTTDLESVISWNDLKAQLNAYAMAHEITRISSTSKNQIALLQSVSLGLQEMMNFSHLAFFSFSPKEFQLQLKHYLGNTKDLEKTDFPLGFLDGQYGDAIFLNRHIIADPILEEDPFASLGISKYICFPLVSQLYRNQDQTLCQNSACPCKHNPSPTWWAEPLGPNYPTTLDEDSRRKLSLQCPEFNCHGLLWIDLSHREMISSEEVTTILNILTNTSLVLENFQIQEALQKANSVLTLAQKKADRELLKAQEIQKGLLPQSFPSLSIQDKAYHYSSADRIGGDYFDCFSLDNSIGIVVADVSGHGISAALFMSMFKVLLKTYAKPEADPFAVLTQINDIFLKDTNAEHFVTVFFGIFTPTTRELRFCNAGHVPIFMTHPKGTQSLKSNGIFVGGVENMHGGSQSILLPLETRLLLYTDGISECTNPQQEQWGEDILLDLLVQYKEHSCKQTIQQILQHNKEFRQGSKVLDDITLLCLDL